MAHLPPDRSHVLTEQRNPRTMDLHALSVAQCVQVIQQEDRAVIAALEEAAPQIDAFISAAEPGFVAGGRLVYVGAGTSGRLGVLDASEAPPTFQVQPGRIVGIIAGGDSALRKSSEGKEDDPRGAWDELRALDLNANDSVIGIAAGGTTPYVHGVFEFVAALSSRPKTALLTCSPVPQPERADHMIVLATGPEVLTGSTRMKAGTATKMALNTISTVLMIRSGRVYENLMVDMRATNEKLRDRGARIITTLTGLARAEALELLGRAGNSVKAAVVMHHKQVDHAGAERLLGEQLGRLEKVLGDRRI
ncbi:MAG: N-acetylmuramic acid 6-phosphate etherase [Planctomycetes bacterium]|nr:N-acetylmuramic acid 6-phosphate etherase [Planctomycetota bacterium]